MRFNFFVTIILLIMLLLVGCNYNLVYPTEENFSLSVNVLNDSPKIGEETEIRATLNNDSEFKYSIRQRTNLIIIYIYEIDEPQSFVFTGPALLNELQVHEKVTKKKNIKFDKPGQYRIIAVADFSIINSNANEEKKYQIKSEPLIIKVVD